MLDIEISYTWSRDDPSFNSLIDEYGRQHGINIRLRRLDWTTAWADLFTMVSEGQGSDISILGSTWVGTLAKMDALRPFKPQEVADTGIPPAWQNNTTLSGDAHVWSIPWSGWMYFIFYRKDLLQTIGLDPSTAFNTPEASQASLATLKASALEIPWLNADIPHPYIDYIHTAASWVWGAGGEYISPGGGKALFDRPEAISGLANWLNTYRSVPVQYQQLSMAECSELLRQGRVAAAVVDIITAHTLLDPQVSSVKQENIGFSNLTNTPWVGGGSLVIWEHTRMDPERERAAVELVKFLSSKQAHVRPKREADILPLRTDALEEGYPPGHPLREAVMLAASRGRTYYNVSHWRRFESRLCLELGAILKDARDNPAADSKSILQTHLEPAARQLNLLLEQ
jgi:multiple sugar transport system substrate-binding protein